MKQRFFRVLIIGALLLGISAACSSTASSINIEGAWGRPSPMLPTAGGIYMLIKNSGNASDTLLSASSPACQSVEFHKTVMKPDGTMGMELVDNPLVIPAEGQMELKVGDVHAMCIMKNDKFAPGNTIDMTLMFEKAKAKTITVDVREK